MEVSQGALLFMMLSGALLGAVLGVVYDVFRLIRRAALEAGGGEVPSYAREWKFPFLGCPGARGKRNALSRGVTTVVTVLCDLAFGLISGISVLLLVYDRNDGIFRLSAPVGVAVGFFLYRMTLGRLVGAFEDAILFFAGVLFRYLLLLVTLPFRLLFRGCRALYCLTLAPLIFRLSEKHADSVSKKQVAALLEGARTAYLGKAFAKDLKKKGE